MKIKDLHPRMPVTISKEDDLAAAARTLSDEDIGALVVEGPSGVVGIISERDIVRAVANGSDLDDTEVCEYMTKGAVTSDADAVLGDAISKMNEATVRHIVVTSGRDVTGVLSMRDVLALFGTRSPDA